MHDVIWSHQNRTQLDSEFLSFQSSLKFDRRLAQYDLRGSMAHAAMLANQGIINADEGHTLDQALRELKRELDGGVWEIAANHEDIHTAIELQLKSRIGSLAGKLHTGRSRNDQAATAFRLFVKDACLEHRSLIWQLRRCICEAAEHHLTSRSGKPAVIPGYTHLQVAQPLHLSHWFLAYFEMLSRDEQRFLAAAQRMDECPLGAAALGGTSWPINRVETAMQLGFTRPMRNSIDAVASRDFLIDYLGACASLMTNLSRLAEDLILYSTNEFGFLSMPDSMSTGSSIMPQKKNADFCELSRAKTGRVFGNLMRILTVMKGLPMAYNKDLQEDKEAAFDTYDTVKPLLSLWSKLIPQLQWNVTTMHAKADSGFSLATDLADELAKLGMPFRDAHQIVGQAVSYCVKQGKDLDELTSAERANFHPHMEPLLSKITLNKVLNHRKSFGGSGSGLIKEAVSQARASLLDCSQ